VDKVRSSSFDLLK